MKLVVLVLALAACRRGGPSAAQQQKMDELAERLERLTREISDAGPRYDAAARDRTVDTGP